MKCFYHSADLDGHCSGAIVKHKFPGCEMFGINYGQPFPWDLIETGETVFMVDFSLQPFSDMIRLAEMCDLVWIDHHKSAIENVDRRSKNTTFRDYSLDTNFAACELTWNYLFNPNDLPTAVYYLGRYDIWQHHNVPNSLDFQYGMRQYDTNPNNQSFWADIFNGYIPSIIEQGKMLYAYQAKQDADYVKAYAFETEFEGYRVIAVNKGFTSSLLFDAVYDETKHDIMMPFCYKEGKWNFSLYTKKQDIDVSIIAKKHGGGGHKGASGFQADKLPF